MDLLHTRKKCKKCEKEYNYCDTGRIFCIKPNIKTKQLRQKNKIKKGA